MKNIRFYLEYENPKQKRLNHNTGNVIAVFKETLSYHTMNYDCIGALQDIPDSVCCFSGVNPLYLHKNCKRISEDIARVIHPNLFKYLES